MNIAPQLVQLLMSLFADKVLAFVVVIFLVIFVVFFSWSQSTKQQLCIWVMTSWNQKGP